MKRWISIGLLLCAAASSTADLPAESVLGVAKAYTTRVGEGPFPIFRVGYADHSSWDMAWLRIDWNGHGFDAFVTARTGHVVLRLCAAARARREAAASLTTLRRRSESMFAPLESIGVDDPMFEIGDIARTSAACAIQTPAEAARAPGGET